jgi:hypothetical protein
MIHISQASIDILDALVFLDMLAERTTAFLDISELILILKEELAAFITNGDCHVRNHVFVVSAGPLWAELAIIDNENFFKAHALKNSLIDLNGTVLVW